MSPLVGDEKDRSNPSTVAAEIANCGDVDAAATLLVAAAQTGCSDEEAIGAMARLLAAEEDGARALAAFGKIADSTRSDPSVGLRCARAFSQLAQERERAMFERQREALLSREGPPEQTGWDYYERATAELELARLCLRIGDPVMAEELALSHLMEGDFCDTADYVVCESARQFGADGLTASHHGIANRQASPAMVMRALEDVAVRTWDPLEAAKVMATAMEFMPLDEIRLWISRTPRAREILTACRERLAQPTEGRAEARQLQEVLDRLLCPDSAGKGDPDASNVSAPEELTAERLMGLISDCEGVPADEFPVDYWRSRADPGVWHEMVRMLVLTAADVLTEESFTLDDLQSFVRPLDDADLEECVERMLDEGEIEVGEPGPDDEPTYRLVSAARRH